MAYITGLVLFLIAAAFAWAGFQHKRKSQAEEARIRAADPNANPTQLHPSLSMLADFAPSLTVFSIIIFAVTITVAFFAVDGLRWLTLFDLAGIYALAGGYSYWMYMKTRHRSPETLRALAARNAG